MKRRSRQAWKTERRKKKKGQELARNCVSAAREKTRRGGHVEERNYDYTTAAARPRERGSTWLRLLPGEL